MSAKLAHVCAGLALLTSCLLGARYHLLGLHTVAWHLTNPLSLLY
jgi:hypothetical protein